ncbi:MAG: hypothetical protein QM753_06695 [Thermomicrobiales bacterium]
MERTIEGVSRWIATQRWFGDKGRTITAMAVEHAATLTHETRNTAFVIVRCTFDSAGDVLYFVPVSWDDGARDPVTRDALADPGFLAWLLAGFPEDRVVAGDGTWRWSRFDGADVALDGLDLRQSRLLEVEQSNSSALFDNRIMLKVFRRLQAGTNPDLEVTKYLTLDAGFAHVPAIYGMIDGTFGDDSFVLGVLQAFVPNRGDCWSWFGASLRDLTDDSLGPAVEAVGLLGQRTAEMHVALARPTADPAFVPEIIDAAYAESTLDRVREELEETATLLGASALDSAELTRLIEGLRYRLASADALVGTLRTRIHGDYHLGQILRTLDDDYAIIDFEGEPSRTIAQRREKYSPLRDVAGMLRSLGYAAGSSRKECVDADALALIDAWETRARQVFLDRYRAVIVASGMTLVPTDVATFDAALHILEIEKSLYEARYELNNRPDWLDIPLSALHHLAMDDRM